MTVSLARLLAITTLLPLFNVVSSTWIMHRPGNVSVQIPESQRQPVLDPIVHHVHKRAGEKVSIGYFTNWGIYGANFQPTDIVADTLTHILYSFADVDPSSGTIALTDLYADTQKHFPGDSWSEPGNNLYGCLKQIYLLKLANRNLKVLLSVGGWTYSQSGHFEFVTNPASRANFVTNAVNMIENYGFDGIDMDFEYPSSAAEGQNFADLYTELRTAFDALATRKGDKTPYELTAAVSAGYAHYEYLAIPQMDAGDVVEFTYPSCWPDAQLSPLLLEPHGQMVHVTVVSLMDDLLGANVYGGARTNTSTDSAIKYFVASGATPSKISMGIPLYGHAFENTLGLGQPYNGIGPGTVQAGIYSYKALPCTSILLPNHGETKGFDTTIRLLRQALLFSFGTMGLILFKELVSYDTPDIVRLKAQYSITNGLAGSMFWELSTDKVGSDSLVGISAGVFGLLDQTWNHISFPSSSWDNIRSNMGQGAPTGPVTTAGPGTTMTATTITTPIVSTPTTTSSDSGSTGSPGSGLCTGVSAWTSAAVFTGGMEATYNGHLWTAKWWTEADIPGGSGTLRSHYDSYGTHGVMQPAFGPMTAPAE
ncbi:unnamed protein product [Mycena citricolor]|uniref:GH18 domain-containing protein n=1 Tax=Mycena citricolor TaxID=2018698 RepID=A0AAD2HE17_9AGAR|nr:unnamed protein product [Mycena citricolor]